jgi:hypothetical protein
MPGIHPRFAPLAPLARVATALFALAGAAGSAFSQPISSGFTYQGELRSSDTPFNGSADVLFTLWTAQSGGSQIGGALQALGVNISDGRFSVLLNSGNEFGPGAFNGQRRWIEISVRTPGGAGGYQMLSPRQELTVAPHAAFAADAGTVGGQSAADLRNAAALTGTLPDAALPTSVPRLSTTNAFSGLSFFSNPGNIFTGAHFGTHSGNGAALEDLNASAVTAGVLADARLSPNVALRNASQTFTGTNTFAGLATFNDRIGVGTSPSTDFRMHLAGGTGQWKGGIAASGSALAVVMGELGGRATIGSNDAAFTQWRDLSINPFGGRVVVGGGSPTVSHGTLHIAGGGDASLAGGGYLMAGSVSGTNILMDNDEIMARFNGLPADLRLNMEGGRVVVPAIEFLSNNSVMTAAPVVQERLVSSLHIVPAGGSNTFTISVPGARVGMGVIVSPAEPLEPFDVLAFARVSSNSVVQIRIQNNNNSDSAYINRTWIVTLIPPASP